ncbi:hypothetical protein FOZ60_014122 [Perkinsus olseni]|uniref:Uncharacterized protein n=1 Tax=Perkinsus olseni TaxID=32597 RepID=A0A7J6N9C0_PEROL|nr:hypothetical protein FOZ60_014122 [Perkinsus olseni]
MVARTSSSPSSLPGSPRPEASVDPPIDQLLNPSPPMASRSVFAAEEPPNDPKDVAFPPSNQDLVGWLSCIISYVQALNSSKQHVPKWALVRIEECQRAILSIWGRTQESIADDTRAMAEVLKEVGSLQKEKCTIAVELERLRASADCNILDGPTGNGPLKRRRRAEPPSSRAESICWPSASTSPADPSTSTRPTSSRPAAPALAPSRQPPRNVSVDQVPAARRSRPSKDYSVAVTLKSKVNENGRWDDLQDDDSKEILEKVKARLGTAKIRNNWTMKFGIGLAFMDKTEMERYGFQ